MNDLRNNPIKKQNLTSYSAGELSLIVFNDEKLYNMIFTDKDRLLSLLIERYEFTADQTATFCEDINEALEG